MSKSIERFFIHPDLGLLLLRVGIGVIFVVHGWPKLVGGPELWAALGANMSMLGIHFAPTVWGFLAAIIEVFGGILIALGLWFRTSAALLLGVMVVATLKLMDDGAAFGPGISHPLKMAFVFLGLLFTGPGRFSVTGRGV